MAMPKEVPVDGLAATLGTVFSMITIPFRSFESPAQTVDKPLIQSP